MPKTGIFISYRRDDAAGHAGRLYDRLSEHFGEDNVFMDLAIEPGVDFVEQIDHAVETCAVLLVLIGPEWLTATDDEGRRRLEDRADFVRMEVATALERDIRVIPLLVHGAKMPDAADLPNGLSKLARRNALELSDVRWRYDVGRLVEVLDRVLAQASASTAPRQREHPRDPPATPRARHEKSRTGDRSERTPRTHEDPRERARLPAADKPPHRTRRHVLDDDSRAAASDTAPRVGRDRRVYYGAVVLLVGAVAAAGISLAGGSDKRGESPRTQPANQEKPDEPRAGERPEVVALGRDSGPDGIALAGDSVWVAEAKKGTLARIDAHTRRVASKRVEIGRSPDSVAAGGGGVWVTSTGDDEVTRFSIDGDDRRSLPVGSTPEGVAVDDDGAWVANSLAASVTRIRLPGFEREDIPVGADPRDVAIGVPGVAWVSSSRAGTVTRVSSRAGDARIEEVRVGGSPRGLATDSKGRVWVADSAGNRVIRIGSGPGARRPRDVVAVGTNPVGIAIAHGLVWVTNSGDDTVSVLDEESLEPVGAPMPVGDRPIGVAAGDGAAWVTNHTDGTVTYLPAPSR